MTFNKVTVYGGGLIGSAWATNFIMAGLNVTIYDVNQERTANAKILVDKNLDFFSDPEIGVLTSDEKARLSASIFYTDNVETAVKDAEFIQENGPDNLEIKQSIIATIEEFNTTGIICSSTSTNPTSEMAQNAKHPERILVGHPFNPVHLMPLVEISGGEKTAPEVIEKVKAFYLEVGKEPVIVKKEINSFLVNRLQAVLNREVMNLVYNGYCSVEDIDKAVIFGMGMRLGLIGPYFVQELANTGGIRAQLMYGPRAPGSPPPQPRPNPPTWFTQPPDDYVDVICNGVQEAFNNRPPEQGKDHDSLLRFRDKGLVNLLKFHGKFK